MTDPVRFLLDGAVIEIADADPTGTLLDHLRTRLGRTGTKEGCAEGDCGACTVLVGELAGDGVAWRAVNACIQFLPMLHGRALMTVESLSRSGTPTPLQATMAANGASQCGFCTPGFVMSLHGRGIGAVGRELPLADVIAGNLCRCTGYGPILAAGEAHPPGPPRPDPALVAALRAIRPTRGLAGQFGERLWFAPRALSELCDVMAGGTTLFFAKRGSDRESCGNVAQQALQSANALTDRDPKYLNYANGLIAAQSWNINLTTRSAYTFCLVLIGGYNGKVPPRLSLRSKDALSHHLHGIDRLGFKAAVYFA